MAAAAITATLMAASTVVLRSSYAAWQAHEDDLEVAGSANAVLRHIVQVVRQASGVTAVSGSGDTTGTLTILRTDGSSVTWALASPDVTHQIDAGATQPIATDITGLEFIGYQADGTTETTEPADIRSVRCVVSANQPSGGTRTVSSTIWMRAW